MSVIFLTNRRALRFVQMYNICMKNRRGKTREGPLQIGELSNVKYNIFSNLLQLRVSVQNMTIQIHDSQRGTPVKSYWKVFVQPAAYKYCLNNPYPGAEYRPVGEHGCEPVHFPVRSTGQWVSSLPRVQRQHLLVIISCICNLMS